MEFFLMCSFAVTLFLWVAVVWEYAAGVVEYETSDYLIVAGLSAIPLINFIVLAIFLLFLIEEHINWENPND